MDPEPTEGEETDGFLTNSTDIKNTELKSPALSVDETLTNAAASNERGKVFTSEKREQFDFLCPRRG